jgi:nucleoside-diphosphate-sugar epimerase
MAESDIITVLGSSGFIGSHLVPYLQRQGYGCNHPKKGDESIAVHSVMSSTQSA